MQPDTCVFNSGIQNLAVEYETQTDFIYVNLKTIITKLITQRYLRKKWLIKHRIKLITVNKNGNNTILTRMLIDIMSIGQAVRSTA